MTTIDNTSTHIEEIAGSLEDVLRKVQDITAHTYQTYAPVQVFRQGDRTMVSTAMPVKQLTRILISESADKNLTTDDARKHTNRPFMKDHREVIADYLRKALKRDESYIIPPLTLNALDVEGRSKIYVPAGPSPSKNGYMVLPDEANIRITDGQHRFRAIKQVADELSGTAEGQKFSNDGVLVMMTLSNSMQQVHQDFADAGRTKALPPSLLAAYDTRQPANNAAMQITERVPLLKGRVNSTGTTISKGSQHIFLSNQVLQFVKHSLTGTAGAKDAQFAEQAEAAFTNKESLDRWVKSRVAFLNAMTEIVPDWSEIALLSPPDGPNAADVVQKTKDVKLRQNVPMSGAFLNALGLVSHKLLDGATNDDNADKDEFTWMENLREKLEPFCQIDWRREADIWDDNIVIGKNKIRTQGPAVKGAAENMLALLDKAEQLHVA